MACATALLAPSLLLLFAVAGGAASGSPAAPRRLTKGPSPGDAPAPAPAPGPSSRPVVASATLPFVTASERELAQSLKESEEKYCFHPFEGETDRAGADALMKEAKGHNHLKDALKEEDFDFQAYAIDIAFGDPLFILPVFLACTMLVLFLLALCQAKCMCCRCCSYKRIISFKFKLLIWVLLALLMAILGYFGLYQAFKNVSMVKLGAENFLCSSKELASVTLNGQTTDPKFPGVIDVLSELETLANNFQEGSGFLDGVDDIIDQTTEMYKSGLVAMETLKLLNSLHGSLVADPSKCPLCHEMDDLRPAAQDVLRDNAGYKISKLRVADIELSTHQKKQLNESMGAAAFPLVKLKDDFMKLADTYTKNQGESFEKSREYIEISTTVMLVMTCIAIGSALILVCCGCWASTKYLCYETTLPPAKPEPAADGAGDGAEGVGDGAAAGGAEINPFNENVHKWAARTWCWGFCYCIVTLVTSAVMSATVIPVNETCLLLSELTEDTSVLDELGDRLVEQEDVDRMKAIVDKCIVNSESGEEALLMDLLSINDDSEKLSLRKKLGKDVNDTAFEVYGDLIANARAPYQHPMETDAMTALLEVFRRTEENLTASLANTQYDCDLFDWAEMGQPQCDPKDTAFFGGCLTNQHESDYSTMKMVRADRTCSREEFVVYLKEMEGRVSATLLKFHMDAENTKPMISEDWDRIYDEHIVQLMDRLVAKTDCRYLGAYYRELVAGLCYQSLLAINDVADASMLSGYVAVVLVIIMYLLWRASLDNFDHWDKLTPEEYRKQMEEEEAKIREADTSSFWLARSKSKVEAKPIDPSLIPESVRRRQQENEQQEPLLEGSSSP